MKTIEEAAINYCEIEINKGDDNDALFSSRAGMRQLVQRSFKEGVEFAQRWYSVDEEMPEMNEKLLIPFDDFLPRRTERVLVKTDCDSIMDNFRLQMQVGNKEWVWFMKMEDETVTHWRPIELKP